MTPDQFQTTWVRLAQSGQLTVQFSRIPDAGLIEDALAQHLIRVMAQGQPTPMIRKYFFYGVGMAGGGALLCEATLDCNSGQMVCLFRCEETSLTAPLASVFSAALATLGAK